MQTEYPAGYGAVKIVNGKEVDWIDPLLDVWLTDDEFIIDNGAYRYEQPRSEYPLWTFRLMKS